MTLSILLYAMMVSSLGALLGLFVVDGVRSRMKKVRVRIVAPSARCVPSRSRSGATVVPNLLRPSRVPGAYGPRRR